jgi:hypothetical protein
LFRGREATAGRTNFTLREPLKRYIGRSAGRNGCTTANKIMIPAAGATLEKFLDDLANHIESNSSLKAETA